MRIRSGTIVIAAVSIMVVPLSSMSAQTVFTNHNPSATPTPCCWGPNVGWDYTPSTSYFLNTIETRFALNGGTTAGPSRTATVEFRAFINGPVLGSASFTTSTDASVWVGGTFSNVPLVGATTYFIDFLNVNGDLGTNAIASAPSGEFSNFAVQDGGTFVADGESYDPIMRLSGSDVVTTPEPSSLALLATGLGGVFGTVRRWRKSTI